MLILWHILLKVGDACHRIHPLAGQGVNLGFGDVECLIRKITKAVELGIDIGNIWKLLYNNMIEYLVLCIWEIVFIQIFFINQS